MSSSPVYLSHARYGKQAIRVFRVVREEKWHTVVEYNVTVLLEGDIEVSYTKADNSVVVATDSMKNITYHLAKTSPHILHPERFALHLGTYMVSKYSHIHKAFVTVEQLRWKHIDVNGQEHNHAFWRDGDEKRLTNVEVDATKGKDKIVATVSAGISDLLVLKSTGSAFENFIRDEHTTLGEVNDRIFSTSIDLTYTYAPFAVPNNAVVDSFKLEADLTSEGTAWDGNAVAVKARTATLEVFAVDESASVQASLYKMAERILQENKHVQTVSYSLPNKHYIPVDMRYAGIDNLTPCVHSLHLKLVPFVSLSSLYAHAISFFNTRGMLIFGRGWLHLLDLLRCLFTLKPRALFAIGIICYMSAWWMSPLFFPSELYLPGTFVSSFEYDDGVVGRGVLCLCTLGIISSLDGV